MRQRTHYTEDFTLANGDEVELTLEHEAHGDVTVVETDHGIIVGYLVQDEDCENPIESCDGMGAIHHHPRSRYGRRHSNYFEELGLDSGGDPIIDEDKMQDMWRDAVMALPLVTFYLSDPKVRKVIHKESGIRDYRAALRIALAAEAVGDYCMEQQCKYAWTEYMPRGTIDAIAVTVEDKIKWDYPAAEQACREPGNPDAVMLDLYEHGGCMWSVAGTGMNCRWDTSSGESCWTPDDCLLEELKGLEGEARYAKCVEYAEQACEQYNAWSAGDCYGVVTQVHDKNGDMVESDSCWGYVGQEYAEEELASRVKNEVEWAKAIKIVNPNQQELRL